MQLKNLLKGIYDGEIPRHFSHLEISSICCDSREAHRQSLFVALSGNTYNGADFIIDAIQKGASVIIRQSQFGQEFSIPEHVCLLDTSDPKSLWKGVVRRFYGDPSQKVRTIGITGTNGKTTITYLLEAILHAAGKSSGVIGTVNHRIGHEIMAAKNTTPGILDNQRYLAQLMEKGIEYCAMEVSSHALDQGRVDLIDFTAAVFTNLTGDHLDYHGDMENYFRAKAILFEKLSRRATAVINKDDLYGPRLIPLTKAKVVTYGLSKGADVMADDVQLTLSGSNFKIKNPHGEISVTTRLIGEHNVYNILAAAAVMLSEKIDAQDVKEGIQHLRGVPGRLESVENDKDIHVFVDYAHTEDALRNVLTSLRRAEKTKIILVFGCGGNRDKTKRPKMGQVASELADFSIITCDNPRSEEPEVIIKEVLKGFKGNNYQVNLDRRKAIETALQEAKKGEIVLIAGKGHENKQIFKDHAVDFDDRQVVRNYFR